MKRVALEVDTLRCEANEAEVLEDLLASDGVVSARVDLEAEHVHVDYDEARTTRGDLEAMLGFFGLDVRGETPAHSA